MENRSIDIQKILEEARPAMQISRDWLYTDPEEEQPDDDDGVEGLTIR